MKEIEIILKGLKFDKFGGNQWFNSNYWLTIAHNLLKCEHKSYGSETGIRWEIYFTVTCQQLTPEVLLSTLTAFNVIHDSRIANEALLRACIDTMEGESIVLAGLKAANKARYSGDEITAMVRDMHEDNPVLARNIIGDKIVNLCLK